MTEQGWLPARGAEDEQVHTIGIDSDALIDPSGRRTFCGENVVEVFNDRRELTCASCADELGN